MLNPVHDNKKVKYTKKEFQRVILDSTTQAIANNPSKMKKIIDIAFSTKKYLKREEVIT